MTKEEIKTPEDLAKAVMEFISYWEKRMSSPYAWPLTPTEQADTLRALLWSIHQLANNEPFLRGQLLHSTKQYVELTKPNA